MKMVMNNSDLVTLVVVVMNNSHLVNLVTLVVVKMVVKMGDDEDEENEFKTRPCIANLCGRESKKEQNKRKNRAVVGHREKMKINS